MTVKQLKSFATAMRELGVYHLKTQEFEIFMNVDVRGASLVAKAADSSSAEVGSIPAPLTPDEEPIKHEEVLLTSLMKLSDTDLVDELFPDHTEPFEEHA